MEEDGGQKPEEDLQQLLETMQDRYGLDFAGHLDQIFQTGILHRTTEYMRKHKKA